MRRQTRILGGIAALVLLAEVAIGAYVLKNNPTIYNHVEKTRYTLIGEINPPLDEIREKAIKLMYPQATDVNNYDGAYKPFERLRLSRAKVPPEFAKDALFKRGDNKCRRRDMVKEIICRYEREK